MRTKNLSLALTSITVMGIVFAGHSHRKTGPVSVATAEVIQANTESFNNQISTVGPIRNLRFTLFEAGIRPSELRIKAGLVNILIEDKTNTSQGLVLQRLVDNRRAALGRVQKAANQSRGRAAFELLPGQYELYDASHPANKAMLVVER